MVQLPGSPASFGEKRQYLALGNDRTGSSSQQFPMAAPGIILEGIQVFNDSGTQRIQVDIPHQFQQVGIAVADNGFVTILEQVADTIVAQVENYGVTGKQTAHEMRKLGDMGLYQQMEMGIQQSPGETLRPGFAKQPGKAGEELFAILVIEKNRTFLNPSDDDMMQ
ncbi:MAG: hypothetical protein R2940_11965 [Syntrophotaleaceae bacterium]